MFFSRKWYTKPEKCVPSPPPPDEHRWKAVKKGSMAAFPAIMQCKDCGKVAMQRPGYETIYDVLTPTGRHFQI